MITIIVRKRQKKNSMQGWLLWFALTAAFSLMGVGMASWQGELDVGGELGTAHIGVAFTENFYKGITPPPDGWPDDWNNDYVQIYLENDKELKTVINNAYEGLKVVFYYEIENTGSLPVEITEHGATSSYDGTIVVSTISSSSIGIGNKANGTVEVTLNNVEPDDVYTFSVQFIFKPDI